MSFTPINFGQNDEELFKAVKKYQLDEGLRSFSEAGRKLLELALCMKTAESEQKKKRKKK